MRFSKGLEQYGLRFEILVERKRKWVSIKDSSLRPHDRVLTICYIDNINNDTNIGLGEAYKCKADKFDKNYGRRLALQKCLQYTAEAEGNHFLDKQERKELWRRYAKRYNDKVVCRSFDDED